MENTKTVLGKIKEVKSLRKITNSKLSELSGIPLGTLNKILSGETKSVKTKVLNALLKALDIDSVQPLVKKELNSYNSYGYVKVGAVTPSVQVANVTYNIENIISNIFEADNKGVSLLVFPELCITGYTILDLVFQETLLERAKLGLLEILEATKGIKMLIFVGMPLKVNGLIYNVAVGVCNGKILGFTPKTNIPNYNELSEKRYFTPANNLVTYIDFNGEKYPFGSKIIYKNTLINNFTVSAEICEDLWAINAPSLSHSVNGSFITVNLSASNEIVGRSDYRKNLVKVHSQKTVSGYVLANAGVGESTTDLVFGGGNLIFEGGHLLKESKLFTSGLIVSDIDLDYLSTERSKILCGEHCQDSSYVYVDFAFSRNDFSLTRTYSKTPFIPQNQSEITARSEFVLNMQAQGLAKRIKHTNTKYLVFGLSGGLDSSLALLVCVRAMDLVGLDRKNVIGITMPCFGTSKRTKNNALILGEATGITVKEINITNAVRAHFIDIEQSENDFSVTYENAQARERTQVLMDVANKIGGMVIGTGDLSELALGWATYNGDHMSMYSVNSAVPKTLIRHLVDYEANRSSGGLKTALKDVLLTPVSPELIPPKDGEISQKTEDIVGPYILHDFYLYYCVRQSLKPSKIFYIAKRVFKNDFTEQELYKWLVNFYNRFFAQQFKRSCLPDGIKIGSVGFSPRGDWRMPSDACKIEWLKDLESIKPNI